MENIKAFISVNVFSFLSKLLIALVIFYVGKIIIKKLLQCLDKVLSKKVEDPMIRSFAHSVAGIFCFILLFIITMSVIGIEMTSLVAVLGAATLAIGLALQGSLANFAGGFLIVLFKPFEVGDYIEAAGHSGVVDSVQIFYTIINTVDNKKIIIPNGQLSNHSIINYSRNDLRRVDIDFGISYKNDYKKAKEVLLEMAFSQDKILKSPEPFVRLKTLSDSSVNLTYRVWVKSSDYWDVYFDSMEAGRDALDREGIEIPYPQLDIHINKDNLN